MAFCRSVFLLALSVICVTANSVPVFLWGDLTSKNVASNPLSKVNFGEFNQIVRQQLKESPFTVIFIEETLSVEDFSHKNSDGTTLFPYLHSNIEDSVYLPSVESALRVFNKVADPEKVDHVKLTENGLSAEIKPEGGQFIFINLKDAKPEESRNDMLKRHNDFIEDMFGKLKERYENVIGVYTAHYPSFTIPESYLRVRRQSETQSQASMYVFDGLLLYVKSLELLESGEVTTLTNGVISEPVKNGTALEATLTFANRNVSMIFDNVGGYWLFNKVQVTKDSEVEEMLPVEPIYAIEGFSYRCGQAIVFESVNTTKPYSITFNDVKLQAYTENATTFGESLNCVGFFSVPIWSGLFVVFILLSITFYGIMMMMDIRSMDRFDDPKGKTITINTSE